MTGRSTAPILAAWVVVLSASARAGAPAVDVRPRAPDRIASGTVIGRGAPPEGWTDLVLLAAPRLGAGDVAGVSQSTADYGRMFHLAILARVRADGPGRHALDRVALGIAMEADGRHVVVDGEDDAAAAGPAAGLGWVGRRVLAENSRILKAETRQVARSGSMAVIDSGLLVVRDGEHRPMVLRHAILADPATGRVSTFVWLLAPDGEGRYALAENGLRKLPPSFREDRILSVDGRKFTLGIPSADAFALAKIPQGRALGFSEAMKAVAASRPFTAESALRLESELRARYVPVDPLP